MKFKKIILLQFFLLIIGLSASALAAIQRVPCSVKDLSRKIIVGVIDTGVDSNHPFLKNSLWINPGESGKDIHGHEKSTNGIDDDGNGYVDDVHGWNFIENNSNIEDVHGHGTHISGLILAGGGELRRESIPNDKIQVMVLKNYHSSQEDNISATVTAINYAVDQGVKIINISGGGATSSREEYRALRRAADRNIWIVAAAGNEGKNTDMQGFFPASYDISRIISVGALNRRWRTLAFSNFGAKVDIMIPGEQVFSSLPGGKFGAMSGTSQSAARVSGYLAKEQTSYSVKKSREVSYAQIKESLKRDGLYE